MADAGSSTLLWEACRFDPDLEAIDKALATDFDVGNLLHGALAHGVEALLWRALGIAGRRDVLGESAAWLEQVATLHQFNEQMLLPQVLRLALEPLMEVGLEPVVLKGPSLAARYPAPGMRSMSDLDVLLPRAVHDDAVVRLRQAGWKIVRPNTVDRYDTVLRHPDVPAMPLELHFGLEAPYRRLTSLDAESLWSRRIAADCLGLPSFRLAAADELVMLAVHASKPFHHFRRLIWIADLAVVIRRHEDATGPFDWDAVRRLAVDAHCTTVVSAALTMALRIGADVPERVRVLPGRRWRADALASLFDEEWPAHCDDDPLPLRFALVDLPGRRLSLVVGSRYVMSEVPVAKWAADLPRETLSRIWGWTRSLWTNRGKAARVSASGRR